MKVDDLLNEKWEELRVPQTRTVDMYLGTCRGLALSLEKNGFNPTIMNKELRVVSTTKMAEQMAQKKDCNSIVKIENIPANKLKVINAHEHHTIWDAIDAINRGEEVKLNLFRFLQGSQFKFLNKLTRKVA